MQHEHWMRQAIEQARAAINAGQAPFGTVIVRGDTLVAAGHNEVWHRCDPTAHAEIVAIRRAATNLQTIDLHGCTLYTTCEPCPMCAAAIHWCKLDEVVYGATIADAHRAGFSELTLPVQDVYRVGGSPVRVAPNVLGETCTALFDDWLAAAKSKTY